MDTHTDQPSKSRLILPKTRRTFLKGAAAAGVGSLASLTILGGGLAAQAHNRTRIHTNADDPVVAILTIARTAEQLAVTFYTNGVNNAQQLGISGDELSYLKAALIEEQIHQQFFTANGANSLADTFSFPDGAKTFEDLPTFIKTQQQLEGVFDSAFLAAVREFADMGHSDLAQVSAQIACVEAEHRVLGRVIGGLSPANNWAYTPVLIASVADAPAAVQDAGYLSPVSGNSYTYAEVSTDGGGVDQRVPFAASNSSVGRG